MPATAYVLINCEYGFQEEIIDQLKELPELVELYAVCGSYDIIEVTADTINKLKETISLRIRKTDKITSTLTLIAIEGQH
ncbi:MAG TPA: Lrp/AsnC ligand binding domain-containing protein [Nitrososphaeraceae archaeon]